MRNPITKIGLLLLSLCSSVLWSADYQSHQVTEQGLEVKTDEGLVLFRFLTPDAIEAFYQQEGIKQQPSFALVDPATQVKAKVVDSADSIEFKTETLSAKLHKSPFSVSYYRDGKLILAEEKGFFAHETMRGFRFKLQDDEKLLGTGQRVVGMDRRGQRLPLYNKASYGYTTEAQQMYFGLPAVMSSEKYLLLFDNSASGFVDLGKTEKNVLQFEAVAGRTAYIVMAAPTYPKLIEEYVTVTGKQPLPPRWALGNFASRFGYRTEAETRAIVDKFAAEDFPLDAVVLDLYWFGPDIQGHMGNLAWDKKAFPNPKSMISDFKAKGVNTVLITEPFVLSTSKRWDEAVQAKALATDLAGKAKTFDFYFGNTGLVDVFSKEGTSWFEGIYNELAEYGVAGWWGDLGEPEVHPSDAIHSIGSADEIHNVYGHRWAELVYQNRLEKQPEQRPMIMMRSGFAGSQRFGMIPWTGDVSRSWDGLKPQVELALQMGLLGLAYTHSDLGGFAGGEVFDKEMYIRWLQYGVFQPVYRPHAQEQIAPEPVLHDKETKDILREYIKLRYRLTPYNYTLAYQNSSTGMPLMRPLFFENEADTSLIANKDSYLWGDAFLVTPVTAAGVKSVPVQLPAGVWLDYWTGKVYQGGKTIEQPTDLTTLPVLVRAGSFVPMVPAVQSLKDYSSRQLELHYYHDQSIRQAKGQMYEDDGKSPDSLSKGQYELLTFNAEAKGQSLAFELNRTGLGYLGMPKQRYVTLVVHQSDKPNAVTVNGRNVALGETAADATQTAYYDAERKVVKVTLDWNTAQARIQLN
ncbi:family 31 glycosyl hydrolase, alpha-glucosidase [Rheinheimera sp. A13L]|uniref:glycoside hydrolase family 31 protein n=1 Tax=Rheinheimera sp. A13L TaxID=506534 RepID=UPI000212500A|nr:TIM-barrel domain-containing protein [Rheinheimera sp. A13L]EGM77555.1 family 31 glycosyl hydrolase, alpha-glucosidase [Rheinheimera sp. A13L]